MSSWYYLTLMPSSVVTGQSQPGDPRKLTGADFYLDAAAVWKANSDLVNKTPGGFSNVTPAQVQAAIADQWNGGNWVQENTYDHFIQHAAFAQFVKAMRLGKIDLSQYGTVAEIEQAYANQHQMALNIDVKNRIPSRTSILVPPVVAANFTGIAPPPVIPPVVPPTPPPPAKDISMGNPFNIAPGQHVHLPLTFDDGQGGPSLPPTGVGYSASPTGLVTLTPDANGVDVLGDASGSVTVTVTADNGLTDTVTGTVTLPLAGAIHLNAG